MISCWKSSVRLTAFVLVLWTWFLVPGGPASADTIETHYVYSAGGQLLAEYEDGVCVKEYIYSGGQKLVAEYLPQEDRYLYYTADQIGSTRMVTDQAGEVVHSAAYGPYGDVQKQWNELEKPKPGFSGKEREGRTGLDYFSARYYDSQLGRFASVDPIRLTKERLIDTQRQNLYAYARNNPISFIDPHGKDIYIFVEYDVESNIHDSDRKKIYLGITSIFAKAGVTAHVYQKGSFDKSKIKKNDTLVKVTITPKRIKKNIYGQTFGSSSKASYDEAPLGDKEAWISFITNVVTHEVGHACGALPEYDLDASNKQALGYYTTFNEEMELAKIGSIMESGVEAKEWGKGLRWFSEEDAEKLRKMLQ